MADNVTITEGTQTTVATDDVSGVQFQKIKVDVGGDGVSSPWTGSITAVGQVHNAGTIASIPQVSVGTIPQVSVGTVPTVTINDVPGGTLDAGTVTVSSFTPDPLGSVHVTNQPTITGFNTGTISTGSVTNIATLHDGTVAVKSIPQISVGTIPTTGFASGTITTGSLSNLAMIHAGTVSSVGTTLGVGVVSNLTSGSVRMTVGTLTGGTLGNLNFGTVDTYYRHPDEFATTVSTGTSDLGTIKAAVGGSAIYVTDLVVSAGTATNVEIASGGTSTPILGTLHLATNGGAVMNFKTPIRTASGSALVYKQSVAGALTITANGYVD